MPPVNYMDPVICNTKFHTVDVTRAADSLDTVGGSYWKAPNIVLKDSKRLFFLKKF